MSVRVKNFFFNIFISARCFHLYYHHSYRPLSSLSLLLFFPKLPRFFHLFLHHYYFFRFPANRWRRRVPSQPVIPINPCLLCRHPSTLKTLVNSRLCRFSKLSQNPPDDRASTCSSNAIIWALTATGCDSYLSASEVGGLSACFPSVSKNKKSTCFKAVFLFSEMPRIFCSSSALVSSARLSCRRF